MMRMGRRQFIRLGLVVAGATGLASIPAAAAAAADLTVFDRRFPGAAALALRLAHGKAAVPISGDATELALWLQAQARCGSRASIQGVTPESVPFCLQQVAPRARLSVRRVDRDLFEWAVRL